MKLRVLLIAASWVVGVGCGGDNRAEDGGRDVVRTDVRPDVVARDEGTDAAPDDVSQGDDVQDKDAAVEDDVATPDDAGADGSPGTDVVVTDAASDDVVTPGMDVQDVAATDATSDDVMAPGMDVQDVTASDTVMPDTAMPPADVVASDVIGGCTSNRDCLADQYCAGPGCDGPGTCQMRPDFCTGLYDPVCGCNRTTYNNACLAASAGQRVAHRGACP